MASLLLNNPANPTTSIAAAGGMPGGGLLGLQPSSDQGAALAQLYLMLRARGAGEGAGTAGALSAATGGRDYPSGIPGGTFDDPGEPATSGIGAAIGGFAGGMLGGAAGPVGSLAGSVGGRWAGDALEKAIVSGSGPFSGPGEPGLASSGPLDKPDDSAPSSGDNAQAQDEEDGNA